MFTRARMGKAFGTLVLLMMAAHLAGCVVASTHLTRTNTLVLDDVRFPVSLQFATHGSTGLLAFGVSSTSNASLVLTHEAFSSAGHPGALHAIYMLDDGTTWVPATVSDDYEGQTFSMTNATAYRISAGPIQRSNSPPASGLAHRGGLDFHFTDAKNATLVVMWSNLEATVSFEGFWLEGAAVTPLGESADITAIGLSDMGGGPASVGTYWAAAHAGGRATVGKEGNQTFVVVRLSRNYGDGELTLTTSQESRTIPLAMAGNPPGNRFWISAAGPVSLMVRGVGVEDLHVSVVAADLPDGFLPALWHEQELRF